MILINSRRMFFRILFKNVAIESYRYSGHIIQHLNPTQRIHHLRWYMAHMKMFPVKIDTSMWRCDNFDEEGILLSRIFLPYPYIGCKIFSSISNVHKL